MSKGLCPCVASERIQIVCTLNIGTFTGKAKELAIICPKRCIDVCALQEIRYCCTISCEIGHERCKNCYRLLYFASLQIQCSIGIVISEGFRDTIKRFERFDDRLIKLTIVAADHTIHSFLAYPSRASRNDF